MMSVDLRGSAFAAANRAIRKAIDYAPASRQRLSRLAPQVWRIRFQDFDLTLDLVAEPDTLLVAWPDDSEPDARISGTVQSFIKLMQSDDKTATLASSDLRVEGSTRSFMHLQELLQSPDFDAETALGDAIGDLPAHALAALIRRVHGDARSFVRSAANATNQYIVRERGWLVTGDELVSLRQRVHGLRRRVDRLSQRIVPGPGADHNRGG